jgi:hypothetical protein
VTCGRPNCTIGGSHAHSPTGAATFYWSPSTFVGDAPFGENYWQSVPTTTQTFGISTVPPHCGTCKCAGGVVTGATT